MELPVSFLKSYSMYAGVQDALVQWWYGHNAVAFFLTTPFLGLGYYYIPKLVNRPIYSYKLSVLYFWSLYTDWKIGHVHGGGLGWNAYIIFGMFYWLLPNLCKRELYSKKLANAHFWLSFVGILLYIISMFIAGISTAHMLESLKSDGALAYPSYMEIISKILPLHYIRAIGGGLFFIATVIGSYTLFKTFKLSGTLQDTLAESIPYSKEKNGGHARFKCTLYRPRC